MVLGVAGSAFALDKAELDQRIRSITGKFAVLQAKPDKAIPAETLRKAQGIILLDRTKAGFIFGYQGGGGVAMLRDPNTGEWSTPAFLAAREASLGFQAGRQQSFIVILLMKDNLTRVLTDPTYELGGEARGTAGSSTRGVAASVSTKEPSLLVFDHRQGLYGGVATKGGAIVPDHEANRVYYGQTLSMDDILVQHKGMPTDAVSGLVEKLSASPITASR